MGGWRALPRGAGDQDGCVIHALSTEVAPWPCSRDEIVKSTERKVPEHTSLTAPPSWHQFSDYRCFHSGPAFITYRLTLRLPHAPNFAHFLRNAATLFLPPSPSYFWIFSFQVMTVDTVVDLRQRAGELAQRLGSLGHFLSAAQELLDIIRHLSSEILLRHSRKVGSDLIRFPTDGLLINRLPRLSHL